MLLTLLFACLASARALAQTPLDPSPAADSAPSPAPAPGGFLDDLFGRFLPRIGYSYDAADAVGREGGLSAFQAFIPVWEDRGSTRLVFSDSRLLLFDNKGTVGANLGLGGRIFSDYLGRTVGGYVYWDYSDTGRASFNQVSGGFETLGDLIDARANFYVPVSKDRKTTDLSFTPAPDLYFQGNSLLTGGGQGWRSVDQALYGFDTEAGLRFFANDSLELRAFAGMYHYQADQASQAWGPRGRLEARIRDTLAMGLSVQNDRLFGTTVNLNVLMTFPRLSGRAYSDGPAAPLVAGDRLGDPIVRGQQVAVLRRQEQFVVPGKPLVDPLTGQPYVFLHVAPGGSSDGSFENPYGSLAEAFADPRFARGNLVIYDRTLGAFAGNVHFAPGTRLLASGPAQSLDTADGGHVRLPFSGASPDLSLAPTIQGTVTLASRSVVSGFDFHAPSGSPALAGPDAGTLRDVTVAGNRFTGGGPAVYLPSVSGSVVVAGNRIASPTGGGVVLGVWGDSAATIQVRDNQITQAAGDAIRVVAGGRSVTTLEVKGNTVEQATGSGAVVTTSGGAAVVRADVRGNTIKDGGAQGDGAIVLDATGKQGSSVLSATVADNQLPDNASPGVTARSGGANTLELDLFGNQALSPQAMFSFLLQQHGQSAFRLVGPETLGARNTGSVVTTGTITAQGPAQ
jgi:hypothetical protein